MVLDHKRFITEHIDYSIIKSITNVNLSQMQEEFRPFTKSTDNLMLFK